MDTDIQIVFDAERPVYEAGETIAGRIEFGTYPSLAVKQVEVSVLWHTMGKGDEDSGVILFETFLQDGELSASTVLPFGVQLPPLPVSYDGVLLKIHWLVRVRVFPRRGPSFGSETRFQVVSPASEFATGW
ncbi:MAG: hypothetical protein ACE5H9_05525 [Anaerolineae bacterium]